MDINTIVRLLSQLRQLRARERWTRETLQTYQAQALRRVREYAQVHSPFYQQFHRGSHNAPLQDLPILTKAMVMEHFDDLVTDRVIRLTEVKSYMDHYAKDERFLGRYWINSTSGSTGDPGLFLFNRSEWITVLASIARAAQWGGIEIDLTHRVKTANVASVAPFHMSARVNATARNWWMRTQLFAASESTESIVERLNTWLPEIVIAYASVARILADEQLAGRLKISPHTVFTSSEVLTDETRRRIVQAWGERVLNQYAATECGSIAAECSYHQGMHLMEDLVLVENVDQNNSPVPPGVFGDTLLITVFGRRTQPLIRYELRDSVRFSSHACPCGSPFVLVDAIQGRVDDMLSFPGAASKVVNVRPFTVSRIMDTLPVSGWQVAQEADGLHILLSGIRGEVDHELIANNLRQALVSQGAIVPPIEVQQVTTLPKTSAGKSPLIKSNSSCISQ